MAIHEAFQGVSDIPPSCCSPALRLHSVAGHMGGVRRRGIAWRPINLSPRFLAGADRVALDQHPVRSRFSDVSESESNPLLFAQYLAFTYDYVSTFVSYDFVQGSEMLISFSRFS